MLEATDRMKKHGSRMIMLVQVFEASIMEGVDTEKRKKVFTRLNVKQERKDLETLDAVLIGHLMCLRLHRERSKLI